MINQQLIEEADRTVNQAPCPVCRAPRQIWCSPDRSTHSGRRMLRLSELEAVYVPDEQEQVVNELVSYGMDVR
jgi:hypothetical protein